MGVDLLRYRHVSPGVYTGEQSIRTDVINTDLFYKSTTNVVYNGGGKSKPFNIYYGYYPLKSNNGIYTEQIIDSLKNIPFSNIISYSGVNKIRVTDNVLSLDEITIPLNVTEEELHNRIVSGETYNSIADNENNCIVMILPTYVYKLKAFDLTDQTFNKSIENIFNKVNGEYMDGTMYDLLVMYNNHFGYSRIGKDKIISPILLEK